MPSRMNPTPAGGPVLTRQGRAFPPVGVAGRQCHDAASVINVYRPAAARIDESTWAATEVFVRKVVSAVDYQSPASTLLAMKTVTTYAAWALHEGMVLDPEVLFTPDRVEHYCAVALTSASARSKATLRGVLRRVGRACTVKAPWRPEAPEYPTSHPLAPPYTTDQVAGFWAAAESQATSRRSRVLTCLLTLGLGAGLRSREIAHTTPETVTNHDDNLWTVRLPDRVVPVRTEHVAALRGLLAHTDPGTALIGHVNVNAKDPLEVPRRGIELPAYLPRLAVSRLRTTWAVTVLTGETRMSEFLRMAGTTSAKTLEVMADYVPVREDEAAYLRAGAGLS